MEQINGVVLKMDFLNFNQTDLSSSPKFISTPSVWMFVCHISVIPKSPTSQRRTLKFRSRAKLATVCVRVIQYVCVFSTGCIRTKVWYCNDSSETIQFLNFNSNENFALIRREKFRISNAHRFRMFHQNIFERYFP